MEKGPRGQLAESGRERDNLDFDCEKIEVIEYWRTNADGVTQTMRGPMGNILPWFAKIAAVLTKLSNIFSRVSPPVSEIAAESRAESAAGGDWSCCHRDRNCRCNTDGDFRCRARCEDRPGRSDHWRGLHFT
jgi:hypothetical protein